MSFKTSFPMLAVVAATFAFAAPAAAITPLSVELGGQVPSQASGRSAGGNLQTNLGATYDFGPVTVVPIRASFQFDDANGSGGNGKLNEFGVGVAGRLTTPLYVGAGISLYHTDAKRDGALGASVASTAIGTNYFIGDRFLSLPGGTSFSLQATYKAIPSFAGINPSAFGVGLRVQL